ncbi:MAG TPA: hypothetical protein VGL81_07355 [Polyangiaceae bacterium]|jgi:hypothetical protein
MNRLLLLRALVAACSVAWSTPARADDPAPSVAWMPAPTALQLRPLFGEPTGDANGLAPALAVMPLRLSLMSATFPIAGALGGAPCASREEASGNTTNGFAVQRQSYLALTPQLVLHGFSSAGCPLDAGIGGGLTFAAPVAKSVFLVAGAGAYTQPSLQPGRAVTHGDARIDLVFKSTTDRAWGVGLGRRGLKLTGTW